MYVCMYVCMYVYAYVCVCVKQDELAVLSHDRALAAQEGGKFDDEIVPIDTELDDDEVTISEGGRLL